MANSPKIEVVAFYDASGVPLTGLTPTFDTYKDDLGTNLTQPTITEIGGGFYKFTPDLTTTPTRGIVYVINGGISANPQRQARFVRPEDYAPDLLIDINDATVGRWQVFTSGPDINRMVLYRVDGSVLKKFDLLDAAGAPTTISPYRREPV